MFDDIANNVQNTRPGVIVNHPDGEDVYDGVPKDYVGDQVTASNFYAVLLGDKGAVSGGSRKVVDSGPEDHIFVYYSDHGGPGIIGMPAPPYILANDLISVLKKKHASGTYKSLVFYLESCESGSMFEGMLPANMNIYATTSANATEPAWATYCEEERYNYVCLGDLYGVSWMEDSDRHNLQEETLGQQYGRVKKRTARGNQYGSSHVMQYGDEKLSTHKLSTYMGNPHPKSLNSPYDESSDKALVIDQRDASIVHIMHKFQKAPQGSAEKSEAQKQLTEAMAHRMHLDDSVEQVGKLLFGIENGPPVILTSVRPAGKPLVEDWDCLKSMVRAFETSCGSLSQYGIKHMRSFANICNAGVKSEQMAKAAAQACTSFPSNPLSSLEGGFTV